MTIKMPMLKYKLRADSVLRGGHGHATLPKCENEGTFAVEDEIGDRTMKRRDQQAQGQPRDFDCHDAFMLAVALLKAQYNESLNPKAARGPTPGWPRLTCTAC
jgi:hypothetical protein